MKSMNRFAWVFALVALLAHTGCGAHDGYQEEEAIGEVEELLDTSKFTGWAQIPPGTFNSPPALVSVGSTADTLEAYGRGLDNAINYNYYNPSSASWNGWVSLGGVLTSKPAATIVDSQRIVVAKGGDNAIWVNWTTGGHSSFVGWSQINGTTFNTAPAVVYMAPYVFVVARKSDNKVYWTRTDVSGGFNNTGWTAWDDIPIGAVTSEPAITAKSGTVVVAARGTDDAFWIISSTNNGATWASSWKKVGAGTFSGAPAISYHGSNVELAGRGTDNFMWVATANPSTGATTGWAQLPFGLFNSSPAIAANIGSSSGKLAVVGKGTDNAYWINRWQ
jgi:hypothetical protein